MMGAKETSPPEERPRPEDGPSEEARDRTQGRVSLPAGLDRVQVAARRSRHTRFTALLHHVDEAALLRAFQRQRRAASAGVDGMTVEGYERDLERNIRDLCDVCTQGDTGRSRCAAPTFQKPTAVTGPLACRRWRTKLSKAQSRRC